MRRFVLHAVQITKDNTAFRLNINHGIRNGLLKFHDETNQKPGLVIPMTNFLNQFQNSRNVKPDVLDVPKCTSNMYCT